MTKTQNLLILVGLIAATGCSSTPKVEKPYDYNGALSELHRQGNPNTRPAVPHYSDDLSTPEKYASRVCVSKPLYDYYGRFIRYTVVCY